MKDDEKPERPKACDHEISPTCDGRDHWCPSCGAWRGVCPEAGTWPSEGESDD